MIKPHPRPEVSQLELSFFVFSMMGVYSKTSPLGNRRSEAQFSLAKDLHRNLIASAAIILMGDESDKSPYSPSNLTIGKRAESMLETPFAFIAKAG
jgi:hypothetical protein